MANNPIDKITDKKHAELSVDPSRLKSVAELVDRNREVHERARGIVDLGNNEKVSPPIVLKDSPFEDGQGMVIGFVLLNTQPWKSTTVQTLSANVYAINSGQLLDIQDRFDDIAKLLVDTDGQAAHALRRMIGRDPDGFIFQLGLGISTEAKELDEINETTRMVASKGFMFSRGAVNLRSNKKRISKRIDEIDEVIAQFEGAATDYELNPNCMSWVDETIKAISALPETYK